MKRLFLPLLMLCWAGAAHAEDCAVGTYRLDNEDVVDVASSGDGALRWRRSDGTSGALRKDAEGGWTSSLGWTERPDGIRVSLDCAAGRIGLDGARGARIAFDMQETRFTVEGATLAGRLVMPRGEGRVPVVVLIHGAEHGSARDAYALQRLFPAFGIGAFVYDKRGTGGSGGRYTQDYLTLATDAVTALAEARRLAGPRAGRIGYQAGSQGGWVAPLAARMEPVDFIIVSFGLAVSPSAAERELIAGELTRNGFGADAIAKAMQIEDAVEWIIDSRFQEGYDELEALRRVYEKEPWPRHVRGSIAERLIGADPAVLRVEGPKLVTGVPLYYDPMPVLRRLDVPQLWLLAGDDEVAPPAETTRRLAELARAGRPIAAAVFPRTEHGLYEYEAAADGTRLSTRQPAGYFAAMRDFIHNGRLDDIPGADIVTRPQQSR